MVDDPVLYKDVLIPLLDGIRYFLRSYRPVVFTMQIDKPHYRLTKLCNFTLGLCVYRYVYVKYFHNLLAYWW